MLNNADQNTLESMSACFRQLPGLVFWKDTGSVYYGGNETHRRLLGLPSVEKIAFKTDYDMPYELPEFADVFRTHDRWVIENKEALNVFEAFRMQDGHWRVQLDKKAPLRNSEGFVIGVIGQCFELGEGEVAQALNQLIKIDQRYQGALNQSAYTESTFDFGLTPAQEECLFYLLRAQTAKRIALMTGRTVRTVEAHINALKLKFGCFTKADLVEKAIHLGYLAKIPKKLLNRQLTVVLNDA